MSFIKNQQHPFPLVMAGLKHFAKLDQEHGLVAIPPEPKVLGKVGEELVAIEDRIIEYAQMDILLKARHQGLQQGGFTGSDIGGQDQKTFFTENAILEDRKSLLVRLAHEDGLRIGSQGKGLFGESVIFGIHNSIEGTYHLHNDHISAPHNSQNCY